ncbi:MAG: TerB N-terminal domain-containing protein [Clostridia bacterium]|nr:TerB N-terminal domain-containing protein [Clostridia bacterium]
MSKKGFNTFDLNDDFWDIDEMLPKKKVGAVFSSDTDTVEIQVNSQGERKGAPIPKNDGWRERLSEMRRSDPASTASAPPSDRLERAKAALKTAEAKHLSFAAAAYGDKEEKKNEPIELSPSDEPLFSYSPKRNPLIENVTVRLWPAKYSFYEQFRNNAVKYFDREGKECQHEPFFSFTPQYVQMTRRQLEFYFYFRSKIRRGEAIKADYSYILLLVYEIINVPDLLPPENGLDILVFLWESYRKEFPKLDRHLSEWICDYCLIHKLDGRYIPYSLTGEAARSCSLKEFYVGLDAIDGSPYATALFSYASLYNYRNSKFINNENRELFDTHIKASFIYAFTKAENEHLTVFAPIGKVAMTPLKVTRDAFVGALCAYNVKRRIEVSYLSVSRSAELRYAVTDAIKFAENNVRAMLGIRSRFHTPNLALPLRHAIEEYFAPYKKELKKEHPKEAPAPEYDVLYEPISHELSLSDAKHIEEHSWVTTELLTEGLEEYELEEAETAVTPEKLTEVYENDGDGEVAKALICLINNDKQGFVELSHNMGILPDALCEAVNDRLYDTLGDIAVEHSDDGFTIVVDYMEEIDQWLKTRKK